MFKRVTCDCGNEIVYMTLNSNVKCQKCGSLVGVVPCTEEDFAELNKDTQTDETGAEGVV